jgi:hypothetical protein
LTTTVGPVAVFVVDERSRRLESQDVAVQVPLLIVAEIAVDVTSALIEVPLDTDDSLGILVVDECHALTIFE